MMPSVFNCLLIAVCIGLVVVPTKYDPAIRLKKWLEKQRGGRL